jgi:hypothetical protein
MNVNTARSKRIEVIGFSQLPRPMPKPSNFTLLRPTAHGATFSTRSFRTDRAPKARQFSRTVRRSATFTGCAFFKSSKDVPSFDETTSLAPRFAGAAGDRRRSMQLAAIRAILLFSLGDRVPGGGEEGAAGGGQILSARACLSTRTQSRNYIGRADSH